MPQFSQSIDSFGTNNFTTHLKQEFAAVDQTVLPLHHATTQGGIVDDKHIAISVLNSVEKEKTIEVKVSVFFDEIVGGCSCGDPPMKVNNYCEMLVEINKKTAEATFILLSD